MPANASSYEHMMARSVDAVGEGDECPECKGKGYWRMYPVIDPEDRWQECERCGGTGYIEREYDAMDDGDWAYDESIDQ